MFKNLLFFITLIPLIIFGQTHKVHVYDTEIVKAHSLGKDGDDSSYYFENKPPLNGHYIAFFDKEMNQPALEAKFNNGRPIDSIKQWYRNGQLKEVYSDSKDLNEFNFTLKSWYNNGAIKNERNCNADTCTTLTYYKNGVIKKKSLESFHIWFYTIEFYENGQPKFTPRNPNSTTVENVTTFFPDGQKQSKWCALNGVFTGPYKEWDSKGNLTVEGMYDTEANIKKDKSGDWGDLEKKIGTWIYYNADMKVKRKEWYEAGKLIRSKDY